MHSQSVWVIYYILYILYIISITNLRKPTRIGAIDSGRRPQHSDAGLGGFLRFLEDPVNAGLTILWIPSRIHIYYCASRMNGVAAMGVAIYPCQQL